MRKESQDFSLSAEELHARVASSVDPLRGMRDGSLICIGKGNEDWNFSAPHGAGRLMSRSDARASFTVSEFKKQMEGIYTTSVNRSTLDECPMAYKGMEDILDNIGPTAEVVKIIRPIYNFKAGDEE